MRVPDDLTVELRNGVLTLCSGGRVVTIDYSVDRTVQAFKDGPIPWARLELAYLRPALWLLMTPDAHLQNGSSGRIVTED